MGKIIRKAVATLGLTAAGLALMAGPASAHVITVTNPKTGEVVREGWVGGDGAAHGHGLITACGSLAGNDVVSISAPWNPLNNCKHFGQ